jgi:AmmeMemoRadiSam system protein B
MLTFTLMEPQTVRRAVVAGTWYPDSGDRLSREIDAYCARVVGRLAGALIGLVSPHAGLIYSGPVAAHAYSQLEGRRYDVAVLVGPSHYRDFEGVALFARGTFETPLGPLRVADQIGAEIRAAGTVVHEDSTVHMREHSLEMQLPFLRRFLPDTPIVPLLMGRPRPQTIEGLATALTRSLEGRRALLIASSDLSHYHDAQSAARLDAVVLDAINAFDPQGLARALAHFPDHACGGGPVVSVMQAARALGARDSRVLRYADSGDVSGDKSQVVGYASAAFGTFES